jgi:steroid delta-isomerase-like uncharacterized protein
MMDAAVTTGSTDLELRARREALVRAHMADENRHAFAGVLATFPHPHYELVPTGAVHDGLEAVSAYYQESRSVFPDQRNELISLRHADDAVVVEFWLLGTHRGAFRGIPPTDRPFRCRMSALFLFEGDRLVCERVYFDTLTILRQLIGEVSLTDPQSLWRLVRTLVGAARGLA